MIQKIQAYCDGLTKQFDQIPEERKALLQKITEYISRKVAENKRVDLVYICTHNSRRSHFGQVWAQTAARYYNVKGVSAYSGGTEATAFNVNAINALERIGFIVKGEKTIKNPTYQVFFDEAKEPVVCFSKVYDHDQNPQKEFAAIMTCGDAEENCPFIPGAELRISTTYDDPKAFDGTDQQDAKYDERCRQIAFETLYVFSLLQKA